MNVIQIEMIHKRQNENIAGFLTNTYLRWFIFSNSLLRVIRCQCIQRRRHNHVYIIMHAAQAICTHTYQLCTPTLPPLLLSLPLRTTHIEYGRPSLNSSSLHRPHRRPYSKYLKYFNRRSGASPRSIGFAWLWSKILSFHITHCDGYHTKAIKGSDNGSQMGPNSNCICVFTFRPNFSRRLLRQLSK